MSSRVFVQKQTIQDLLPTGGFWRLVQELRKKCNPTLKLNEVVTEIDYSQAIVKVTTNKGVYYAKKVISSLPIGVLQAKAVNFVPTLPESLQKTFDRIGNGI